MYSYFWTWNPSTTIPWTVFAAIRFDFILVSNSNHIYQVIKRPVRLPCQHYFCRDCVNFSKCHVCGRTISLTELCEDKVLNYVVESSREATESCANCDQVCLNLRKCKILKLCQISQPMYFCETCQQPLCSGCRETTHKAKIFSLHHIVQLEERGRVRNRPFCSIHNEPFILFCLDSKVNLHFILIKLFSPWCALNVSTQHLWSVEAILWISMWLTKFAVTSWKKVQPICAHFNTNYANKLSCAEGWLLSWKRTAASWAQSKFLFFY